MKDVQKFLKEGISAQMHKTKKAAKIAHGITRVDADLKMRQEKRKHAV